MAVDYGTDLYWVDDLDPTGRMATGVTLLGQAVYHRITTQRGSLLDDTDYGLDVRELLHGAITPVERAAMPGRIRQEILKDERVEAAEVTLTEPVPGTWSISIVATPASGPTFRLVLAVDAIAGNIKLLEAP